ncbi:uncharacterized protein LOC125666199 [Ostrea edulis]|uniref:uncharacterized protein LOC125666199 n=1 Tax=Ostrea edulis TaxID=37623 RepID=UPI0024AFE6BD|nr:uncharacterized protein LOC125666199 [Ostrea edulis]
MSSSQPKSPSLEPPDAQHLSEQKHQVENFTWIQCDSVKCQKWRKVLTLDVDDLDDMKWFCNMNSDPMFNSCDVAEEDYTAYDRLAKKLGYKYVFSCLPVGTLVWAKTPGYCRWPAIVTVDPEFDYHYEVDHDGFPCRYHVEYLGRPHCHAWVPSKHATQYGYKGDTPRVYQENSHHVKNLSIKSRRKRKKKLALQKKTQKLDCYKKSSVMEAIQEADLLLPLTSQQRLDTACKFKGSNSLTAPTSGKRLETACKSKGSNSLIAPTSGKRLETTCKFKGSNSLSAPTSGKRQETACKSKGSNSLITPTLQPRLDTACKFKGSKSLPAPTLGKRLETACKFKGNKSLRVEVPIQGRNRFKRRRKSSTEEDRGITNGCSGDRTCDLMSRGGDSNKDAGREETPQNRSSNEESVLKFEDLKMSSSLLNHSTEERFTINIQQYRKNEKAFNHDLQRFILRNGLEVQRMVIWNSKPVRLFQLFLAVHERGGYDKVCERMQWSSVYSEVTDSVARGQCGHRAKLLYWRNIYPYELYIKGQNYQSVIRCIKAGSGIAPMKKKSQKSDKIKDKFKSEQTGNQFKSSDQTGGNVMSDQTGNQFKETDDDTRWRTDEDKCDSSDVLPEESPIEFDHILQELHNNSSKIFQLQDEMEGTQTSLGIHIKFYEDSTPPSLSEGLMEAHTAEEFCCAHLPVEEARRVPSIHFTSSESSQSQDVLHELQAMEETFDDIDKEITSLIIGSYL